MSRVNVILDGDPFFAGLSSSPVKKTGFSHPVKTASPCKSYTADRAKIAHLPAASSCAERLFNDSRQGVGVTIYGLLLLALDHDAREGFRSRITQQ